MSDQKDVEIKDRIKIELNNEMIRKNNLNFSSKESEKCDQNNEKIRDSLPSSSLNSRMTQDREKEETIINSQKCDQNNREVKFWFLDSLASFLLVNARTIDGVSTDSNNSINNCSNENLYIGRCRELDVNKIKLDDKKCEIVRAFILEMEIAAIITPSYRNRKRENNKNVEKVFRKMSNKSVNGYKSSVKSRNDKYDHGNGSDDNNNNDGNDDNKKSDSDDKNKSEENQNENLIFDFIKSVQSLTILFKAVLPESETQHPVIQNNLNSHTNKQSKYGIRQENDQNKAHRNSSKNNLNLKNNKYTDINTKCTEENTTLCTEKEQDKLYHVLCVCFCAILDSFNFFQTAISKKSVSEIVEIIFLIFISNPDIKSTLVKISTLFHNYNKKTRNLSRNLWSRICSVHRFSAAIPELIYRITSNPHFPLLDSVTTSTPNKIISNENENEHKTANQNQNLNNSGRIKIEKENELSFISSIENIRTSQKRKHYPFPSVLLTPNNSTHTSLPLPTSLLHSNTSSSQEISFLSSLPQIREFSRNGVLAVDENRTQGKTEFKKTEFVETENDLTNPLLWEEFSDLIEEKNASGGEVEYMKGKEEGKGKEKEEEKEGRADMRGKEEGKGIKGMRIESVRAERKIPKNENYDPSGKRMKTEKKEISDRGKMKKKITSKSSKEKIELTEGKKEKGVVEGTQLWQDGYDHSVQNNVKYFDNNAIHNDGNDDSNGDNYRRDNTDSGRNSNSNSKSNSKNTNINNSFSSQNTPTGTTKNTDTHTNSTHKTTQPLTDLGSDSVQFKSQKKKIEPFHNLPISKTVTNTNTRTNAKVQTKIDEYDGIKKETFEDRLTTSSSASPPLITIPEIIPKNVLKNVPGNVPENVPQNTEAGWNKKDISKKWSMSF